jgi:hypothetical protein
MTLLPAGYLDTALLTGDESLALAAVIRSRRAQRRTLLGDARWYLVRLIPEIEPQCYLFAVVNRWMIRSVWASPGAWPVSW